MFNQVILQGLVQKQKLGKHNTFLNNMEKLQKYQENGNICEIPVFDKIDFVYFFCYQKGITVIYIIL